MNTPPPPGWTRQTPKAKQPNKKIKCRSAEKWISRCKRITQKNTSSTTPGRPPSRPHTSGAGRTLTANPPCSADQIHGRASPLCQVSLEHSYALSVMARPWPRPRQPRPVSSARTRLSEAKQCPSAPLQSLPGLPTSELGWHSAPSGTHSLTSVLSFKTLLPRAFPAWGLNMDTNFTHTCPCVRFQDTEGIPETAGSSKPHVYCAFSYTRTALHFKEAPSSLSSAHPGGQHHHSCAGGRY